MSQTGTLKRSILLVKYLKEEEAQHRKICEEAKINLESELKMLHYEMNVFDLSFDGQFETEGEGNTGKNRKDIDTDYQEIEEDRSIITRHPGWVKKIFKKIVFITHPDKIPEKLSSNIKEIFLNSYRDAKLAFDMHEYVDLSIIASDIGIDINSIAVHDMSLFKKKEIEIRGKINNLKKSIFWVWAHSNEADRKKIINEFLNTRDWTSRQSMRKKSRKGPGKHPGKSISWARNLNKKD